MSRFIVIEGLIGVGKTTLCRILEGEWGASTILEPAADNPFLARYYADPEHFAFPAQMFYLATRYLQQHQLRQQPLFSPLTVADYLFEKDQLFAEMTLSGDELALYRRFLTILPPAAPKPDFVLFLDASTETILSRIRRRGLGYEQEIPAAFLDDLRARYYRLWETYSQAPVHVLHTDELDYANQREHRELVLNKIQGWMEEARASR